MKQSKPKARLFVPGPLSQGEIITLAGQQAHYISNVMHLRVSEALALFNGRDGEWLAAVVTCSKKEVTLKVDQCTREQTPEPDLWLAFAPIKRVRIDYMAQKATELGVSKLIPVKTMRTVVTRVKTERLATNAREAAEQCERLTIPEVVDMAKLDTVLDNWPGERRLLFCDEEKGDPLVLKALMTVSQKPARSPWGILIGPEGGFTSKERELIRSYSYCIPASLGPRVLRADTAALAALSLWQAAIGDW
jgi:16S rRNA (uracil1498-N3)-methyltransferase